MKPWGLVLVGGCALVSAAAGPAHGGIFNGSYNRADGYFLPNFFAGSSRPQTTIMRGFCYDFILNGDFIDFIDHVEPSDGDITSPGIPSRLNGAQNSVNGHPIGQVTVHFCLKPGATANTKTIKLVNFGGGEFDRLVLNVTKGGVWTSFTPATARVNIPFQFTVNGSDLKDATIEGNGVRRVTDPSDVNTDAQLRMTLVFDPAVGAQTGKTVLFLRRFTGGTGVPLTDPGMVRDGSGHAAMTLDVSGSTAITGTIVLPPIPQSGPAPTPTPATIDQLRLTAIGGKSLRHVAAFRKIDEFFCQGFPLPAAGGATEREVNVPQWGLSLANPNAGAFSGAGTLQLVGPVPAPAPVAFGSLASARAVTVPFSRPVSVTLAILILPTTSAATKQLYGGATALGCYQSVMLATDQRNWVDPQFSFQLFDATHRLIHQIGF